MYSATKELTNRVSDLELKMEHVQRDMTELKSIVLELSVMIHKIQTDVNYLLNKEPRGL